ncbi:MAG: tetratricopeptide repeat protein, partial [Terracidiphilus sp.]
NHYELAAVCLSIDEEKCAVQALDWIEASTPDTPALHMTIGLAYGQSDFTPRAVTEFKKVVAEDPSYPEAHYCVAAALLATGEDEKTLKEAESELKEELTVSHNDFLTYAALGKIALSYHRNEEAETDLKRAIELNAKNPDAFLYLGQLDYETSRLKEAEANLRKSIQLTTDESRNHFQIQKAHFLLGRILMQEHREAEAHAEMQTAHAFNDKALTEDKNKLSAMLPASGGAIAAAAPTALSPTSAPKSADPEAARKVKVLEGELTPPIADSYNNLGAITASQERYAEALAYFEQAYAWKPSLEGLDYNLGRAAFMAADFAHAIPPLTRYLHAHPQDAAMRAPLAMSQFMTGNYSACLEALKAAPQSVTGMPQMQLIYAQSLVRTGQVASGFARLQSLEKADPNDPGVHRGIGEVYVLRRDWLDAIRELEQSLRLKADDPETHYDLGKAELESGDTAAAVDDLQAAVRLMPRDPRFHQELAAAYDCNFNLAEAKKERQIAEQLKSEQTPAEKPASASTKPASR